MSSLEPAPLNLLDTTNPRQIASVGHRLLSQPAEKFDSWLRQSFEDYSLDQAKDYADSQEWWNQFHSRHSEIPNGDLTPQFQEMVLHDYVQTVSDSFNNKSEYAEPFHVETLWRIVDSLGGSGITISPKLQQEMLKVVLDTSIALNITIPVENTQRLMEYAAYRLVAGKDSPDSSYRRFLEEFKRLAPQVSVPKLVPLQRATMELPDHVKGLFHNPRAELARITTHQKAKAMWKAVGIHVPDAYISYTMDETAPIEKPVCREVVALVEDPNGRRIIQYINGLPPHVVVTRQRDVRNSTYESSVLVTEDDLEHFGGLIEISGPNESNKLPWARAEFTFRVRNAKIREIVGAPGDSLIDQMRLAEDVIDCPPPWQAEYSASGAFYKIPPAKVASLWASHPVTKRSDGRFGKRGEPYFSILDTQK